MDWQPIETAPRDGTWVLITGGDVSEMFREQDPYGFYGGPVVVAFFDSPLSLGEGGWSYAFWDSAWRSSFDAPTHWMPLPAPPVTTPD
jgi:hypothetical protein